MTDILPMISIGEAKPKSKPKPALVNPFTDPVDMICNAQHVVQHEGGMQCYLASHPESPWHWDDFLKVYWTMEQDDPYAREDRE